MLSSQIPFNIQAAFDQLFVFGDSLTDYGSLAAYVQKTVLAATALPAWSGVTFSNANAVSQLGLRSILGIATPSTEPPDALSIPNPFYQVANPYVAIPDLGVAAGPSFAIGGATSSGVSLYDVITVPTPNGSLPLSTLFPKLASTGVRNQIREALKQGVRPTSNQLTLSQGGANDLLIAYLQQNPDIEGVLNQVMANMRQNLSVQLRAMGSRQLMTFALAPFRGLVDGVAYQMPFLSDILQQASEPGAAAWLQSWKSFVEADGLEKFQSDYAAMVQDLAKQFPYAAVIYQSPEFGANWANYGEALGNFESFGISDALTYAQLENQPLTEAQTNKFLYFDSIHNTESGQAMVSKAMGLTLAASQSSIEAASLQKQIIGSNRNDRLLAVKNNTELVGLAGNDWLRGGKGNDLISGGAGNDKIDGGAGNDWISGGKGSDELTGGKGADFFAYQASDIRRSWQDRITDFDGSQGDRLGLNAILDADDPFDNPGWTFIGSQAFSGSQPELSFSSGWLQGDSKGDGRCDFRIKLSGVEVFDPSWIS
jgi:phospholipase/lecithinase/hemolysin